jgi:hypothetical protein
MKIIFHILFFVLTAFNVSSQENTISSNHLMFKGIPIDGTLSGYVAKMKQNGFVHVRTEDGIAILRGDFAGYKDCKVGISTLKQKDLVYKIVVFFPERETWSSLSGNYFDLKEMLIEKYGEPSSVVEVFNTDYQPNDDSSKMFEVQFDRCKYYTTFETEVGTIGLSIEHDGVISCYVVLEYSDKINSAIIKEKAKGDL